jgi:hypothetical protein
VCWLGCTEVMQHFVADRSENKELLESEGNNIQELENKKWLCDLAFLAEVTFHLNCFNQKLH